MKNLLIITQKVDENDDLLGFFVGWIREFSKKFNKVFVITLAKGEYELPVNVFIYSLGKERGTWKITRLIAFYKLLFVLIPKSGGIFVHMSPIFVIISWPVAFIFRKKIVLWYLHRSVTFLLRLAEKLCYKIVTATKESVNIKSKKLMGVGHGIKVQRFQTLRNWDQKLFSKELQILSVGRISEIKDYKTLIETAAILRNKDLKFRIKIVGRPVMPYDFDYFESLKKQVKEQQLENLIDFVGFVPYSRIAPYYKEADIFINLAPKGGIDKVVLEAMASGSLVLVSNTAFRKYFGDYDLFFKHGSAEDLAEKIIKLSNLPVQEIESISNFLVQSVKKHHNLTVTIANILEFFQ